MQNYDSKLKIRIGVFAILLIFGVTLVFFYFVPAFQGKIRVNSGFYLGSLRVGYYGLIITVGILIGFFLVRRFASKFGFDPKLIEDVLPWIIISGLIGARLYFVIFSWDYYRNNFLEIFKIWHGGLSIYGAILGASLGTLIYARLKSIIPLKLLDLLALVTPLGQSIGRFGNFFNQEAFGEPTDLAWKMYIEPTHRPLLYLEQKFFHPTFLYESFWDLGIFFLLLVILQKNLVRHQGFLAGSYLALYGLGRFFIEALRLDSIYLGSYRLEQVVSVVALTCGIILILRSYGKTLENF